MMKLNKDQQFFYDTYINFAEELAKQGDRRILELLQQQKINKDLLLQQIAKVLLDYNIIDSILDINATEKIFIYNKFSKSIDKLIGAELKNELNREKIKATSLNEIKPHVKIDIDKFSIFPINSIGSQFSQYLIAAFCLFVD